MHLIFFFFFQAEDGIRDSSVTGVQTCALPISTQHRLSLFEIGVAARELCRQALVVGHRGFHLLLRRRMSLIQALLALALGVGPNQVRTYCFPTSFSRRDLRLCLIDTGERFGYTRVLQLALATVVFDGG